MNSLARYIALVVALFVGACDGTSGVVLWQLPTGVGPDRDGARPDVAETDAGVRDVVTDSTPVDDAATDGGTPPLDTGACVGDAPRCLPGPFDGVCDATAGTGGVPARCNGGAWRCNPGTTLMSECRCIPPPPGPGSVCGPAGWTAPSDLPPRPIAPPSASVVSGRPAFRWAPTAGTTETRIQVCRDRACTVVVNAATVTGSAWQPTTPLPQGLYYWRLFGVRNAVAVTSASVAWNFRVGGGPSSVTGAALGTLDINGDGYAEVLVGAFRTSPGGRPEAGAVHVYAGSNVGIPATESLLLEGEVARDLFGVTVGSAGDINGDGYVDVLVGASGADPGGRRDAGRVYVYLGSAAGLVTPAHRVLDGEAVDDLLGSVVATAGDVNGDGYADTILGANQASPGGRAQAGAAYVYLGGSEGLSRAAPLVLAGMAAGDHFGSATAGAGDVNGDGYADVVVGAYRASPGGRTEAGAAYVYLGGNEGLSTTPHRVLGGTAPYDSAGVSVAGAGDVNGDGYADVIVGATGADPGGRILAGAAYVYLGSSAGLSATPRVLEGAAIGDAFGNSVACAGDLNGDGYADVIVGAFSADPGMRSYAGAVHVYLGGSSGLPPLANYVLEGGAPNDLFGAVVSGGGDVNGDGYADLRVGAYSASPGGRPIAGSAFVYLGGSGRPPLHRVLEGRVTGDVFGCSVANAGEVRRVHRRGA